jgi:hypothetical protein
MAKLMTKLYFICWSIGKLKKNFSSPYYLICCSSQLRNTTASWNNMRPAVIPPGWGARRLGALSQWRYAVHALTYIPRRRPETGRVGYLALRAYRIFGSGLLTYFA